MEAEPGTSSTRRTTVSNRDYRFEPQFEYENPNPKVRLFSKELALAQVLASLTINPAHPEAVSAYFDTALPLIESASGKVVQRLELGEQLIGTDIGKIVMLVESPDREAISNVFDSDAYRAIIPTRDKAFLQYNVSIIAAADPPEFA